jgi:hypothetical protein
MRKIKRDEAVLRFAREVVAMVPAIDKPEYRPLVYNYARIAKLCEQAYSHLHEGGLVNDEGELRASLNTYRQLTAELRAAARELGLTPTSSILLATLVKPMLDLDCVRGDDGEDKNHT